MQIVVATVGRPDKFLRFWLWPKMKKEIKRTMDREVVPRHRSYAERIVANWDHKVKFKVTRRVTKKKISVFIYPSGANTKYWVWTSRGTKKHPIVARRAKTLRFPTVWKPKTTVRGPGYGGPGTKTGPVVYPVSVEHPGTKARHFEEAWARWSKPWFKKSIENAIRRAAKK